MNNSQFTTLNDLRSDFNTCADSPQHLSTRLREFLVDYVSDNCCHPKKIFVRDSFTNEGRYIYVPCGRCAACRDRKQGEWSTRMILQTLYSSKYAYFVTLTYRSFDKYSDIPPVLRDAYYRLDDYNSSRRNTYSPCLLRIEHVQRFMKYLRKIHANDEITFFDGSEYGSDYGRPHHHLVLWSNKPISRKDIVNAWSCRLPRSKYSIHIGKIDYNDLNSNGTIVADGINFGNNLRNCFQYVCKYLTKQFINPNDSIDANSRLNLFIDDLCHERIEPVLINTIFNKRVKSLMCLYADWAAFYADYARENEYLVRSQYDPFVKLNKKIYYDYETSDFSYLWLSAEDNEIVSACETQLLARDWYAKIKPFVLRKVFNCFCNSSRAHAIGMEYFNCHFEEYKKGKFVLPQYNGKKLLLPHLFVRKTRERLQRYIIESSKVISKSFAARPLINKDIFASCFPPFDTVDFYASATHIIQKGDFDCLTGTFAKSVKSNIFVPDYGIGIVPDIQKLLKSAYSFRDYLDNTKCLAFLDVDYSACVRKYKYDRKTKSYVFVKQVDFDKFCNNVFECFKSYTPFYDQLLGFSLQSQLYVDSLFEDLSIYCDNLLEYDSTPLSLLYDAHNDLQSKLVDAENKKKMKITKTPNL